MMEDGLVSAFDEFNLRSDVSALVSTQGPYGNVAQGDAGSEGMGGNYQGADHLRKQQSKRFTVQLSPTIQRSSPAAKTTHTVETTSTLFQPSPLPVQTQSLDHAEEAYSTLDVTYTTDADPVATKDAELIESRHEYAGSESSDDSSEAPFRPLPPHTGPVSSSSSEYHTQPFASITRTVSYPQHHQPPVFYNSTSHASMPLSPPSLFNLVPGGSPGFTYHHAFPSTNSPPAPHYQPAPLPSSSLPPHHASTAFPSFIPPPPPPHLSQPYADNFGLGVAGPDMGHGISSGVTRRNPSPGFQTDADDDEIIETAIVIKSIPFSCPKDQLLALMGSLQLPVPLAFNYHYDLSLNPSTQHQEPRQDQFRGLAFANFRNGEEARIVVCALNGFEFMGRKLRAEFKKVLKPGEKEAIERNKALKRIRSVQLLANGGGGGGVGGNFNNRNINNVSNGSYDRGTTNNELHNQSATRDGNGGYGNGQNSWNRRDTNTTGYGGSGAGYRSYEPDEATTEEYGRMIHSHSQPQLASGRNLFGQKEFVPSGIGMAYGNSGESLLGGSESIHLSGSGSASGTGSLMSSAAGTGGRSGSGSDSEEGVGSSVSAREERKKDLDLNDPQTLQIYSQLLLFSSSPSPPNPTSTEFEGMHALDRKKVKMIANMLGLGFGSEDVVEGGKRVRVWKTGTQPPLRNVASAAALRRPASTSSFHSTPIAAASFVPPPVPALPAFSAYLTAPNSGGLRGKKSMPEFRPSPSSFYATNAPPMPTLNRYSTASIDGLNRKSANNLRSNSLAQYQHPTAPHYPSASSTRRVRESSSVQGLFQRHGILSDNSSPAEEKKEYYSSNLGSVGAEAVRQPRGPGGVSPVRVCAGGELEWRTRRT